MEAEVRAKEEMLGMVERDARIQAERQARQIEWKDEVIARYKDEMMAHINFDKVWYLVVMLCICALFVY